MQRGTIIKQNRKWCLRFYETVLKDGQPIRKKSFRVLASIKDYPKKTSVIALADKYLAPINLGHTSPESSLQLSEFIKTHYLPWAKSNLRPSTVKGYQDIFDVHLKTKLDIRLRDFRTVSGQKLIAQIAQNGTIGHKTLQRIKSFLSGVLTYALREGILDGHNPMHAVKVPGRPKKFKGAVYTLQEVFDIGEAVTAFEVKQKTDRKNKQASYGYVTDGTALAVVCTAAFAGLRLSELRGLRWSDYDGQKLDISRSVWRTHVGQTKTEESEASVPVLSVLAYVLERYKPADAKPTDYMFAGPRRGAPLNLHNLSARVIKPALRNSLASSKVLWKGWHAFRRGLASSLYELNVSPKVIQGILRHRDIGTTLSFYTQVPEEKSREALNQIDDWFTSLEAPGSTIITSEPDDTVGP